MPKLKNIQSGKAEEKQKMFVLEIVQNHGNTLVLA